MPLYNNIVAVFRIDSIQAWLRQTLNNNFENGSLDLCVLHRAPQKRMRQPIPNVFHDVASKWPQFQVSSVIV